MGSVTVDYVADNNTITRYPELHRRLVRPEWGSGQVFRGSLLLIQNKQVFPARR